MGKRNTCLPYPVRSHPPLIHIMALVHDLQISPRKTKHKGPPGAASDSEEDPDGDVTGILGQRAARRAAAIQVTVSFFFFFTKSFINTGSGGCDTVKLAHCGVEFASVYICDHHVAFQLWI